jgi:hypothetical protein
MVFTVPWLLLYQWVGVYSLSPLENCFNRRLRQTDQQFIRGANGIRPGYSVAIVVLCTMHIQNDTLLLVQVYLIQVIQSLISFK